MQTQEYPYSKRSACITMDKYGSLAPVATQSYHEGNDCTMHWNDDQARFNEMKQTLYSPVIGDILDQLGRFHQILFPSIQPLQEHMRIVGRAMPVAIADVYGPQEKPFGLLTDSLDQLQPGEVYIASGGNMRSAYWGEILTATAKQRQASGAVINGYHRDTPQVLEQNWPVFSRGRFAQDSSVRTKVVDFRCPIEINSVWIKPGDIVFADLDGVVIIPQDIEDEVIGLALEKARAEKKVRQDIEAGMTSTEAFRKYGIL